MTPEERLSFLLVMTEKLAEQLQTTVAQMSQLTTHVKEQQARIESLERQCSALHMRTVGLIRC